MSQSPLEEAHSLVEQIQGHRQRKRSLDRSMGQVAQDSNRRFELLEAAIREQATVGRASAEAQVKALEAMTKKSSVVDVKGVGKPETLKGSHEDARKVWKTWSYKFESWFSSQFPARGQECLDWARNRGDETILESAITTYANTCPEVVDVDRQLHVAISLTAEMPYTVVFNARKRCGLDAWRRLCHVYEPHNARSNMRLLRRTTPCHSSAAQGCHRQVGSRLGRICSERKSRLG